MSDELEPTGQFYDRDPSKPKPKGRKPKYPWSLWTNGNVHIIQLSKDFNIPLPSMHSSLYLRAEKEGKAITVSQRSSTEQLMFQFYERNTPEPILPSFSNATAQKQAQDNPDHPKCSVCQSPVNQYAINFNTTECATIVRGTGVVSLHDPNKVLKSFP